MPELPEVEAARRLLERWSGGAVITAVDGAAPSTLVGRRIDGWSRHGKRLAAQLDDSSRLTLHFGMTGRVIRNPEAANRHIRATFSVGTAHIAFSDARRFGSLEHLISGADPFAGLGPDALSVLTGPTSGAALAACLVGRTGCLKDRALDQARIAGLGNIAIIEGCWRAAIHPHTATAALDAVDWQVLADSLRAHLDATLAGCEGLETYAYVSEGGPNPFAIYGRDGAPCPRCGAAALIVRTVRAGRPTFACPRCQATRPDHARHAELSPSVRANH